MPWVCLITVTGLLTAPVKLHVKYQVLTRITCRVHHALKNSVIKWTRKHFKFGPVDECAAFCCNVQVVSCALAQCTKAPFQKKGQRLGYVSVQIIKMHFIYSFICQCFQLLCLQHRPLFPIHHLVFGNSSRPLNRRAALSRTNILKWEYIWVHLLVWKPKIGPVIPQHLQEKWPYHYSEWEPTPTWMFSAFLGFFLVHLVSCSGSGGDLDSSHHFLDLLFILQYVGPYSTNLVLLVLNQLLQLG